MGNRRYLVIIVLIVLAVIAVLFWRQNKGRQATTVGTVAGRPGAMLPGQPGPLPLIAQKPQPQQITFDGCPPEGDGGDPELNKLKNRVDEGSYIPVQFDALEQLPWPKAIERRHRDAWSATDTATVAQYEGLPVVIEGYLANAKREGPESCNCHAADAKDRDFHIWLSKAPGEDRSGSIVVETSPRSRARHSGWKLPTLKKIARNGDPVRISGWVMLDPEHPDQVGKTRGTIWEIHPIMKMEVQQGGSWVDLDSVRISSRDEKKYAQRDEREGDNEVEHDE